ncbi:MAG: NADP-dependent isocitrate dehydrogenase [Firmicutes bacterium]|nr:NADP-dependent isocitrate dehydrogenase [Bacillota bacterium]
MSKIQMTTPIVEMDGDEMTRVLWKMIKEKLLLPFIDLKTEYYDLGLLNRNATEDEVTKDAAYAALKYGVAVKCATITPNRQRMEEYPELTKMWRSPNGTIRGIMGGTVFREPITAPFLQPAVRKWTKPITIARHAYGDIYSAVDFKTEEPVECKMVFTSERGTQREYLVKKTDGPAVFLGQHNLTGSIENFAKACFMYSWDTKQSLKLAAKDTILKQYDTEFIEVFNKEYEKNWKARFEKEGIRFGYTLIDSAAASLMTSDGGYVLALKNYDGDVLSDLVSAAFGSIAMMTSVLVNPEGKYEFEAAHGTVTDHYYRYLKGEKPATNPTATIFAWTGALRKRGELDKNYELMTFAEKLERANLQVLADGFVSEDLIPALEPDFEYRVTSAEEIIDKIAERL